MQIEYQRWWSPHLGQDMELKVYGYFGKPVLVFPAQGGRFHEFEDFGMVAAVSQFIEAGQIKLFTVDSLDQQSWANAGAQPADRARRHEDYDRYITREVVPFMIKHCGDTDEKFITTGCSMGGYHAANFFFRHPDIFDGMISLSGLFQLRLFVGDYMDENVYFNSPLDYLRNLCDPWYLERYRQSRVVVCAGQGAWEEGMLADAYELKRVLEEKGVSCWTDIWGYDVNHDWPWWRKMLPHVLANLSLLEFSAISGSTL
ncbi:MAG: alpha/beta hydrolase-fold protein [Anaerolineales bacterium]|jgi:esterase/lipase superfamily enzyme